MEKLICDYTMQECERKGVKCYRYQKVKVKSGHDIVEHARTCEVKGKRLTVSEYWAAVEARRFHRSGGEGKPRYVWKRGVKA